MRRFRLARMLCSLALIYVICSIFAHPASGQGVEQTQIEPETLDDTDTGAVFTLGSIEVRARRRVEDLQDVPLSITTITEDEIRQTELEDFSDVVRLSPGLNAAHAPQSWGSAFNIRGVGSLVPGGHEDGSVSAYVDGVPVPLGQLDAYYLDVQQIEVLRGPQGTLYGRNAQAGAINITTTPPSDVFEASLGGTVGTQHLFGTTAMITGPLVEDRLNGRFFFNAQTEEGVIRIENLGREALGDVRRLVARGTLEGYWSDNVSTRLAATYDLLDNDDHALADRDLYDGFILTDRPFEDRSHFNIGTTTRWDIDDQLGLSFVTGINYITLDYDFVQSPFQTAGANDTEFHFNQEIRLEGISEDLNGLAWTSGLFFNFYDRDIDTTGGPLIVVDEHGEQTNTTMAIFGEATYPVLDELDFTLGLRLTRDVRSADHTVENRTFGITHRMDEERSFFGWNGRAAVTYRPTPTDTIFGSVSRGYKPGGFQTNHSAALAGLQEPTPGFDSTTSVAYEIGYRGLFFDERASLDVSVYYVDTTGEQVLGFDPASFRGQYFNIDSRSVGFEVAGRAQVTDELSVGAAVAVTDAQLTETVDLGAAGIVSEGTTLPNVPFFSYNIFAAYEFDLLPLVVDDMTGFVRADFIGQSSRYFDIENEFEGDAFGTLDLRAGIEADQFRVSAFVTNVTNEEYFSFGLFDRVTPARERQFGLSGTIFF